MSNVPAETDLPTRPTSCGGSFPTRTSSRPAASRRPQTDHVYALHLYRKIIACSLRSILSLLIRAPSRNDIDERTSSPRAEPLPLLCEARRRGIEAERAKYRRWGGGRVSVQLQKSEARTAARPRRECSRYLGLGGPKGRGMRGEGKPPAGFQG